jgi:hypothetical protein
MASQVTRVADFSSPQKLAFYLENAEQFQIDPLCRTYVDFTRELLTELENLGEITELFTDALSCSKNFLCYTTIRHLLTQYHTALTQTAKASEQFLEMSTEVVNGYNGVLRAQDKAKAQQALERVKLAADKAIALFHPILQPEAGVNAVEALTSTTTSKQPSLQMLQTFAECQKKGGVPDQIVMDAQKRALANIATLDKATRTLGKISTILCNSRSFWSSVNLNAGFVSIRNIEIALYMDSELPEDVSKTTQNASERWLALARINQLVCKKMQPVLTELGKLIAPVEQKPSEGKA